VKGNKNKGNIIQVIA